MIVDLTKDPFRILSLYIPTTAVYKNVNFRYAYTAYIAAKCKNDRDLEKFVELTPTEACNLIHTVEINEDFDSIKWLVLKEIFVNRMNENKIVKKVLKETCLEPIYNFCDFDSDLGICKKTFIGNNLVGCVWEEIRKETFYD